MAVVVFCGSELVLCNCFATASTVPEAFPTEDRRKVTRAGAVHGTEPINGGIIHIRIGVPRVGPETIRAFFSMHCLRLAGSSNARPEFPTIESDSYVIDRKDNFSSFYFLLHFFRDMTFFKDVIPIPSPH
jgi:hypothetical protein